MCSEHSIKKPFGVAMSLHPHRHAVLSDDREFPVSTRLADPFLCLWTQLILGSQEYVFFQTGDMVFALFLRDKLAEDFQADHTTFGCAPMALAHNVRTKREVDALIKQAAGSGAKILKPAREAPRGGYSGYFADPDGFP